MPGGTGSTAVFNYLIMVWRLHKGSWGLCFPRHVIVCITITGKSQQQYKQQQHILFTYLIIHCLITL